jgi:hypothetical protein
MSIILGGKLLKRGSVSWKIRHFVLRQTSIQYFAKADDTATRGELALTYESELVDFSKRPFGFAIITGDKSLTVCASSMEEEQEWRTAIDEVLLVLKQTGARKSSDEWQVVSAAGQEFEMSTKYELIKAIGHGAYGVVISAIDHSSDSKVAIKKIPDTFEDLVDAKRIVREIHLLRSFNHDNVIRVVDLFTPQPKDDFNDVYIVSDLLDTDLHRVIYSQQPLTSEHIQYFLYQMLCGLNYLHSAGVIHRDLKPSNVLMNANCDLRICDFGLSRGISTDPNEPDDDLTEYVVTRWYRAPEIMLSCPAYDCKIDVWSMVRGTPTCCFDRLAPYTEPKPPFVCYSMCSLGRHLWRDAGAEAHVPGERLHPPVKGNGIVWLSRCPGPNCPNNHPLPIHMPLAHHESGRHAVRGGPLLRDEPKGAAVCHELAPLRTRGPGRDLPHPLLRRGRGPAAADARVGPQPPHLGAGRARPRVLQRRP